MARRGRRRLSALLNDNATDRDLVGALTGDYGQAERTIRDKIVRQAHVAGFEMTPAASLRATQDLIRALMLIRAYRVIGHLAADLDPLGLADRRVHRELMPESYGFTEADLDRPIFIDHVMGLDTATMRQILAIFRRRTAARLAFSSRTLPIRRKRAGFRSASKVWRRTSASRRRVVRRSSGN